MNFIPRIYFVFVGPKKLFILKILEHDLKNVRTIKNVRNIFVDTLVFRRITSTEKAIKRFYFIRNISFQNIFLMVFRPQKNNGLGHI